MQHRLTKFHIKAENVPGAIAAVKALDGTICVEQPGKTVY